MGYIEDNAPRMVMTPWYENEIPFEEAAEIGTKKVITDHSTIGLVITTDGSITDIERHSYEDAECRVIKELQAINKPFIVLLNTAYPNAERTQNLKREMEEKYNTTILPVNCAEITEKDINEIIENILFEFPVSEININMPKWVGELSNDHWLKNGLTDYIQKSVTDIKKIKDYKNIISAISECEYAQKVTPEDMNLGTGEINLNITLQDGLFYKLLSEASGLSIESDDKLMAMMVEMANIKREFDRYAPALEQVRNTGYGIISPSIDELSLEEPEIVRQGSRYGVRLKASAPSIHLIRADIETEHLKYKMKMGIKSEKKYQDFEIEYRLAV